MCADTLVVPAYDRFTVFLIARECADAPDVSAANMYTVFSIVHGRLSARVRFDAHIVPTQTPGVSTANKLTVFLVARVLLSALKLRSFPHTASLPSF